MSVLFKVSGLVDGEQLDTPKVIQMVYGGRNDKIECIILLAHIAFVYEFQDDLLSVSEKTEQVFANPNSVIGMIVGELRNEKLVCNKHNAQNHPNAYPPETKFSKTYDKINQPTQFHVHKMQKKELQGATDAYDIIKTWLNHDVQLEQDGYNLAVDDGQKITFYADYYYKKNAQTEKLELELFGLSYFYVDTELTAIQCTPSSIDVDNTQDLTRGTYSLSVKVNDEPAQIRTVTFEDLKLQPVIGDQPLMTPARLLLLILARYKNIIAPSGGGSFWLEPINRNYMWRDDSPSIQFNGLASLPGRAFGVYSRARNYNAQNRLTLSPANDGNLDLFQYLPHNGQDKIVLHSCAVIYFMGEQS